MDALMRSLGLLPKRKARPTTPPPPAIEAIPTPERPPDIIAWKLRPQEIFRLADLARLDPTGSGTKTDRLKHLFGGSGSLADRESVWLASKGSTTGTRYDKWSKYLSVPPGTKIRQAIQALAVLP
jgi:hypothetical protein